MRVIIQSKTTHNICRLENHSVAFLTNLANGTNFGTADRMSGSGYQETSRGTHNDSEQETGEGVRL
jgi:hypothetical protein